MVLLGLNLVVFGVYTLPRTLQERSIATRAGLLREEIQGERLRAEQVRKRGEVLDANAKDTDRFYREIVGRRNERLVPLLKEIEGTAQSLGLGTRQSSFNRESVRDTRLVRFVITMPLSGTYRQLVSFLDRLERSRQFLIVEQLQLHERQGKGADLSVVLSTYFRDDDGSGRGR
jgi:hypothetical protein